MILGRRAKSAILQLNIRHNSHSSRKKHFMLFNFSRVNLENILLPAARDVKNINDVTLILRTLMTLIVINFDINNIENINDVNCR